jgi:uncharacterized protein RhaS with RHS repeats
MQARYYDPVIGRFYSNDPVDMLGHMQRGNPTMGFNRYAYVNNNPYKYTDPNGEFLWGAVIGAGVELIAQVATGQEINLPDIAIAGAVGAVTGGFAGRAATQAFKGVMTGSKAVAQTAAVSGAANGVGSAASDLANGKEVNLTKAATSTVAGAAGGFVGAKGANAVTSKLDNLSNAGGISSQIANTTQSSYVGAKITEQITSGSSTAASVTTDAALSVANKKINE